MRTGPILTSVAISPERNRPTMEAMPIEVYKEDACMGVVPRLRIKSSMKRFMGSLEMGSVDL